MPGTLLKRALHGRAGADGDGGQVQAELADPSKIDRRVAEGPLGLERQKCDFAKRAVVYVASLGVQKYMQQISEKQELLGVLADCMIQIFAHGLGHHAHAAADRGARRGGERASRWP